MPSTKNDIAGMYAQSQLEKEKKERELKKLQNDYRAVFGSPEGQRVFWDIVGQTYVFSPFGEQNAKSYAKEGKRELGLYILAACGFQADAESLTKLAQMLKSANNKE